MTVVSAVLELPCVQSLVAAQARRLEAMLRGDCDLLASVLTSGMSYVHSDGTLDSGERLVDRLRAEPHRYRRLEVLAKVASVHAETGIIVGSLAMQLFTRGELNVWTIRFTEVSLWTAAGWKLVAWQSTRVPASILASSV